MNWGPALDNPYYRGLGCVDFSEGRRDGITAKGDRAKILGGVSQSCDGRSGRDT
jgi:hypothetical protein